MRSETSYRTLRNTSLAKHLQIVPPTSEPTRIPVWNEIPALREAGADPYSIIDALTQHHGIQSKEIQDCLRQIGAGSSPWIQLSQFLLKVRPARGV